jgi:hypothetical protein
MMRFDFESSVEQDGYMVGGELLAGLFTAAGSDGG